MKRLASLDELKSLQFRTFMAWVNGFSRVHGLRTHTTWSKVWEYPWSWQYIHKLDLRKTRVLDIGSEISPMPWFFASLGADVSIVEVDEAYVPKWRDLKEKHGFQIRWHIVSGSLLPLPADTFDLVSSYSVLEHIPDKETALDEAIRVLKPGGLLCLTFDICEPSMGMSFPEWNGTALDMETFDRIVWDHPHLQPLDPTAVWNIEDIDSFLQWHRQTMPHHNYTVGGALMQKKERRIAHPAKPKRNRVRVHQLDTGLGSGNTGDDAMFLGAYAQLPSEFEMSTEVHSLERASVLPRGVNYILATNQSAVEGSIRAADAILLIGDTPIMDQWGLEWPLRSNATKLQMCHHLGKPVHALGVGVDRLVDPEGLRIFRDYYAPIESWSVRSVFCKEALQEMGIAADKIALGADWAWLLSPVIDQEWAREWLNRCGGTEGGIKIGINLVNEIWKDNQGLKNTWARLLDCLIEKYGARVFFFCNESRPGEYYDRAAAEDIRSRMRHPSVLLPDRYYQPAEMISLISLMSITISQRYHFTLFSVLADVVPLSIDRGEKMRDLNQELGLPPMGDMMQPDTEGILREMEEILQNPESKLRTLRLRRSQLAVRARNNLSLLMQYLPSYR